MRYVLNAGNLRTAADQNIEAAVEHFGQHGNGSMLTRSPDALLIAAASDYTGAFHNAALRLTPDTAPGRLISEAQAFGQLNRRDLILWASTHRDQDLIEEAQAIGLHPQSTALGMALHTPPAPPSPDATVELTQVVDKAGVDAFASVHRDVFHHTGRDVKAVDQFATPAVLLSPNVAAVVATTDGTPVSCAMFIQTNRTAGIYWVATTPTARRHGLGTLVTTAATHTAFDRGADLVLLQATALGAPVYQQMGFTPFTNYLRFVLPHSPTT
jgi:GNAT superfamily N-acetyltransferase/uncharacterized protein (DUF1778 family)